MAQTTVPGLQARHARISKTCRDNRTALGAFDQAVEVLRAEYEQLVRLKPNADAHFHLVLTVDRNSKG